MQPQSCYIWPGMEVCGCTRGYKAGQLVNGLIYVIKGYDDEKVTLTQHPDYNKDHVERVKYLQSQLDELQPKMLELLQFLVEKDRTLDEFKAAAGVEEDAEAFELMHLGFSVSKKGRGRNAKDFVKADFSQYDESILWRPWLDETHRLEKAYELDVWNPRPNFSCKEWCPVKDCAHNGKSSY